jgi:signal transduction histidine kinase
LKKSNGERRFPFKLAGVYRGCCLAATGIMMLIRVKSGDYSAYQYPLWFIAYLSFGTVICFVPHDNMSLPGLLIIMDYFAVLLYQYFEPHDMFIEFLWLPEILTAIALIMPSPLNIFLTLLFGIPGSLFLSYGFNTAQVILIGEQRFQYYAASLFFYVPVTLLSIIIGQISFYAVRLRKRTGTLELINAQLDKINRDITAKIFRLQNDTTLEERKRISKEIHDTAGYVFINLIMMLQAVSAILYKDTAKAENLINDARDYAERGINEIRHILRHIRAYSPVPPGIQNVLFDIGQSFQKATGVELTIDYGNWPASFSKKLDSFFISLLQEALTNALKHGNATAVTVMCWTNASHIAMRITDNGKGAVLPVRKGIGISAVEDFTDQQNGSLSIQAGETGFKITVTIPLEAAADGPETKQNILP